MCIYLKVGDIIFFDWEDSNDGKADHVGIVEKVEEGKVYTIEGNSGDTCCRKNYDINSSVILGYGTPIYNGKKLNLMIIYEREE